MVVHHLLLFCYTWLQHAPPLQAPPNKVLIAAFISGSSITVLSHYQQISPTSILLYNMNILQQFNLANQSFLSDWRILYWQMLLYFTFIK